MRWKVLAVVCLACLNESVRADDRHAEVAPLLAKLRETDRASRVEAARTLQGMPSLPAAAIDQIIGFIQREVESAVTPPTGVGSSRFSERTKAPDTGAITSFLRIKASPENYIGSDFVMAGALEIANYYNFGFANASGTHYSLKLTPFAPDGSLSNDTEGVYLSKLTGNVLAEIVTRSEEAGFRGLGVKLRCKIERFRTEGDPANALNSIEITDWQFCAKDGKAWLPWAYEGINLGCGMLFRTGPPSIPKCMDLILDDDPFLDEKSDLFLRSAVTAYLAALPRSNRALIVKQIANRSKKVKSARAKLWARRVSQSVSQGRLVL